MLKGLGAQAVFSSLKAVCSKRVREGTVRKTAHLKPHLKFLYPHSHILGKKQEWETTALKITTN